VTQQYIRRDVLVICASKSTEGLSVEGVNREVISILFTFLKGLSTSTKQILWDINTPVSNSGTKSFTGSKSVESPETTHRTPTKCLLDVSLMKTIWNVERISEKFH
jgi:hypothetical protein